MFWCCWNLNRVCFSVTRSKARKLAENPCVKHCRVVIHRNPSMEWMILLRRQKKIWQRRASHTGVVDKLPDTNLKCARRASESNDPLKGTRSECANPIQLVDFGTCRKWLCVYFPNFVWLCHGEKSLVNVECHCSASEFVVVMFNEHCSWSWREKLFVYICYNFLQNSIDCA